jgi:hypothetical protein
MLPPHTHPTWAALLQGRIEHKFTNAAASMLLFQLRCDLRRDDTPAGLGRAASQLHAFCTKYERMLRSDLAVLFT